MQCDLERPKVLARLLRELPDEHAAPYGWSEFRRRTGERARSRRDRARGRTLAALAVITAGLVALSVRLSEPSRTSRGSAETTSAQSSPHTFGLGSSETPGSVRSEMHTEKLERWLASLPDEPVLVRVGNRAAVNGLEDRLAEVDDLLTAERVDQARPANLLTLQQERRQLVSSLAQVRYAETLADATR
jgi:hypothetical protein